MPSWEGGHSFWAMRQMQRLLPLWFVALSRKAAVSSKAQSVEGAQGDSNEKSARRRFWQCYGT